MAICLIAISHKLNPIRNDDPTTSIVLLITDLRFAADIPAQLPTLRAVTVDSRRRLRTRALGAPFVGHDVFERRHRLPVFRAVRHAAFFLMCAAIFFCIVTCASTVRNVSPAAYH